MHLLYISANQGLSVHSAPLKLHNGEQSGPKHLTSEDAACIAVHINTKCHRGIFNWRLCYKQNKSEFFSELM